MPRLRDIRRRFDRAAPRFDNADFVHAVTRDGLLARLEPMLLQPEYVLDLGSATGATGRSLRRRFKRAHIVSLDISHGMLDVARQKRAWFSRSSFVQGNARQLPFAGATFDLVVANQLLPWQPRPQPVFEEVSRVLKVGGVFAFATLGPDSFKEIARAWASIDDGQHVNRFADMHDIGDSLVRAGLADPVLDVDRLVVSYDTTEKLFADLTLAGARNSLSGRAPGLLGRGRFRALQNALGASQAGGRVSIQLELVYGHCWGAGPSNDRQNYRIDAGRIPLRR